MFKQDEIGVNNMMKLFCCFALTFFSSMFCLAQTANVDSISIDDAAKIIHLLYGEGHLEFGDIQDEEQRRLYGLSEQDEVIFQIISPSLTMSSSSMFIELANPTLDDKALKNYLQRLREFGWKRYLGTTESSKDSDIIESFFMCYPEKGQAMSVDHLISTYESDLVAGYQLSSEPKNEDFKTYLRLSIGPHMSVNACAQLYITEPQNFE
jgi:hypothetical protein